MGLDYPGLLADLRHESEQLVSCLSGLSATQWNLATPAAGWNIQDQVSHLAFFDDIARLALSDPERFRRKADDLMAGGMNFPDRIAAEYRTKTSKEILEWFVEARPQLLTAFAGNDPARRLPWFGPDMSVASSATARLMETWAHGQDVYDTLAMPHPPSPGLRNIAHLGVATFAFAHSIHGIDVPDQRVRIELYSPEGEVWPWGPDNSDNRIEGPAQDFVLTVTQRRHWTETALTVRGAVAKRWLDIAQAFAGAPSRRTVPR
ncbi:TIGR03084 family metal-binding protein [Mycobacterium palustre]|uniref:Wyosine base formation domain-containing protein n=1 Tax=Mycobacterium palustre TaxID=153971 RepID=A0A1X1ZLX3_9MYCO|nr:TIGR03084 family metal-binding protein [Mycobacterium palustre]ORW24394.1 wyosine base formation domain-containing protein [Mycobacterium palustre]